MFRSNLLLALLLSLVQVRGIFRILTPAPTQQFVDSEAQFGTPDFGGSVLGGLWYATPGDSDGCSPLCSAAGCPWAAKSKLGVPVILLLDRGNCTFVQKVRNAQNAAATAVVINDNTYESFLPIMADDGTGGSIFVPSVFISKSDGDKIKAIIDAQYLATRQNGTVLAEVAWDLPQSNDAVTLTWWMSSDDDDGLFKADFAPVADQFGNRLVLNANYKIYDGVQYNCVGNPSLCGNLCTNGGRYCYNNPDTASGKIYFGSDIVRESLRQMCIFQNANASNTINNYWNYIGAFEKNCAFGNGGNFNLVCSNLQQTANGINPATTQSCVTSSGGSEATSGANFMLDATIKAAITDNVNILPSLFINSRSFTGRLDCQPPTSIATCTLLKAICAGFSYGFSPPQCLSNYCWSGKDCSGTCNGVKVVDQCNICLDPSAKNGPLWNTCYGCDKVPNSGKTVDPCGVCGGDGTFDACGRCFQQNDPQRVNSAAGCSQAVANDAVTHGSVTAVALVVGLITAVILGGVFVMFIRHREARMKMEMENVLQRYKPLDDANDFVSGRKSSNSGIVGAGLFGKPSNILSPLSSPRNNEGDEKKRLI